jgi:broad specificity phosphatase PhoE
MKLYFVRHGQSESNVKKLVTGQAESPLTEQGIEEARVTTKELPADFDLIFCSDTGRCKKTAEIINEKLRLPITFDVRLRERHFGSLEGTNIFTTDRSMHHKDHAQQYDYRSYGGESVEDVKNRLFNFISEIQQKFRDKKVLVVTHAGIIRLLHHLLKGKVPEKIHNASVHEFDFPDNIVNL